MEKILLLGAGALARDLIDVFGAQTFVGAYVDLPFLLQEQVEGVPVQADWHAAVSQATHYLLAVSSLDHRERARALAEAAGLRPASPLVSSWARIARAAHLSPGCAVGHFCAVGPEALLGPHGLLMHGVVLGHNAVLEDDVVVSAGVSIGGYAAIGTRTFIGTNAVLAPKVTLGRECFVGAGAVCLRDAPERCLLVGNPARRQPLLGRSETV